MSDIATVLPQKLTDGDKRTLKVKYIDNGDGTFSQAVVLLSAGSESTAFTVQMEPDSNDPTLIYVGKAPIGAVGSAPVWQIKRMDTSSMLAIKWPSASANFTQVWDDRESLSYT